jgi:serine O-acetyltransferase
MMSASHRLLASIARFQYHRARSGPWHVLMRKVARLRYLWWSFITHSDIEPRATLGKGLMLPHPNGVVIHEDAIIGDDCMIMQQVTIGMIGDGEVPTIGDRVYIGAGAKIIGRVIIGDGARIGANAVVTTDVPPNCTAVGVPARIVEARRASSDRPDEKTSG